MNACILLSHVFVRPQELAKLDQIQFTITHYRLHNPDAYIILTGHGLRPSRATLGLCDYVYWCDKIIEREINVGHPHLVNVGIDRAIQKGYSHIFKCRADGVILRKDIIGCCQNWIDDKLILLTQQTEMDRPRAGDLFMFGGVEFLKKCWNIKTWYPTNTGLTSLANNILRACQMAPSEWADCLRTYASFVDIYRIGWIDFRANWNILQPQLTSLIRNRVSPYCTYLWGAREGDAFDEQGQMHSKHQVATEKIWYDEVRTIKIISHRGNLEGPCPSIENTIPAIDQAIAAGFDVEVDLRCEDGILWLGHDSPQTKVELEYLIANKEYLWIHAKNIDAVESLICTDLRWFWNEADFVVLTSKGIPWCRQHVYVSGGITMVDGLDMDYRKHSILGICTDYPHKHNL